MRTYIRSLAGLLLAGMFLMSAAPALAEGGPPVAIDILIPRTQWDATLSEDEIQAGITAGRAALVEEFAGRFPYREWLSYRKPRDGDPRPPVLRFEVVINGSGLLEYLLKVSAELNGTEVRPQELKSKTLYTKWDSKPTTDPKRLVDRILEVVRGTLDNEQESNKLQEHLLARYPLADTVSTDTTRKILLLHVPWGRLRAKKDSTIVLTFRFLGPPEIDGHAVLVLIGSTQVSASDTKEVTFGTVQKFICPPVHLPTPGWDNAIKSVLENVKSLNIGMHHYKHDGVVSGVEDQDFVDADTGEGSD